MEEKLKALEDSGWWRYT